VAAKIIETVIRTRKLLQTLQGRADDLGEALERFKARREGCGRKPLSCQQI
jgi:hypothetical protein